MIWFLIGFIVGSILTIIFLKVKNSPVGIIQIDRTNEFGNGPYMFLELTTEPENLYNKKKATFKILLENLASR